MFTDDFSTSSLFLLKIVHDNIGKWEDLLFKIVIFMSLRYFLVFCNDDTYEYVKRLIARDKSCCKSGIFNCYYFLCIMQCKCDGFGYTLKSETLKKS